EIAEVRLRNRPRGRAEVRNEPEIRRAHLLVHLAISEHIGMLDVLRSMDFHSKLHAEALRIGCKPADHFRPREPLIARDRESQLSGSLELHAVIRDRLIGRHLAATIAIDVGVDAETRRHEPGLRYQLAK